MGGGNDSPDAAQPVQTRLIIAGDEKEEKVRVVCDMDDLLMVILSLSSVYSRLQIKKA